MSQARKSKAQRFVRERERVARFIARRTQEFTCTGSGEPGTMQDFLLRGTAVFDVSATREAAHALLVRAHEDSDPGHVAVWSDWRETWPNLGVEDSPLEPAPVAHGKAALRLARAVLRALEGQPSECQSEKCESGSLRGGFEQNTIDALAAALDGTGSSEITFTSNTNDGVSVDCPDCRGSGHNLRGVLPPVVWPAVVRRKVADATAQLDHESRWDGACWVDTLARQMSFGWGRLLQAMPGDRGPELHARWRVTPRGQHRDLDDLAPSLVEFASGLGRKSRLPRWRRGEIRHAEQRRQRLATRQQLDESARNIGLLRQNGETNRELRRRVLSSQNWHHVDDSTPVPQPARLTFRVAFSPETHHYLRECLDQQRVVDLSRLLGAVQLGSGQFNGDYIVERLAWDRGDPQAGAISGRVTLQRLHRANDSAATHAILDTPTATPRRAE